MTGTGRAQAAVLAIFTVVALGACSRDTEPDAAVTSDGSANPAADAGSPAAPPLIDEQAAWQQAQTEISTRADSADRLLRRVPNLSGQEQAALRRDVNAVHIERARQLGVPRGADTQRLLADGRLVELQQSTPYWVVRELDFSKPYLVPDAEAVLAEIGERFHARLDSLEIPRFRLDVTSVMRTPELQAQLRRRNPNASQIESSHEFGTTLDIAYRRFAPPLWEPTPAVHPSLERQARELADTTFLDTGRLRGTELQAVLGRVLLDMQREGKLLVIMERSQTVYHVTVGQRYPGAARIGPAGAVREGS